MITKDMFREVVLEEHCIPFAYTVSSLARVGMLTAENDTSGIISDVQKEADLGTLFQLISSMMAVVIDGAEDLEARAKAAAGGAAKEGSHAPA